MSTASEIKVRLSIPKWSVWFIVGASMVSDRLFDWVLRRVVKMEVV